MNTIYYINENDIRTYIHDCSPISEDTEKWVLKNGTCDVCKKRLSELNKLCKCSSEIMSVITFPLDLLSEFEHYHEKEKKYLKNKIRQINRQEKLSDAEGNFTKSNIKEIYKLQNAQCYYCKDDLVNANNKRYYEIEHIISLDEGGSQWPDNIALACKRCNQKKGNRAENYLWSYLRKEIGTKLVNSSQRENKKNFIFKGIMTKKNKKLL